MSAKDSFDKAFIEDNIVQSNRETKSRVAELEVAGNNALQNGDPIVGSIIIATTNPENADPTSSDYDGAFISGEEIEMADGSQPSWLAKLAAGIVEFSIGSAIGIYLNRLTQGYKHIADDGTTFRKGELGMTTLEGQTEPSFGLGYSDNSVSTELLTNGGAESGSTTGWTVASGSFAAVTSSGGLTPYAGSYFFDITTGSVTEGQQAVNVTPGDILSWEIASLSESVFNNLKLILDFYDGALGTGTLVSTTTVVNVSNNGIFFYSGEIVVPTGAASIIYRVRGDQTVGSLGFDVCSLKVVAVANYLGFHPVDGKLVSSMVNSDGEIGQVVVGKSKIPGVYGTSKMTYNLQTGGAVNVGTHYYIVTFVDEYGETDADISASMTAVVANTTNDLVQLTSVPLGGGNTTSRRIWRTKIGGSQTNPLDYFLAGSIANNTGTIFGDSLADSSLDSETIPTVNTTASFPAYPKRWTCFGDDIITSVTMAENLVGGTHPYGTYWGPTAANANDGDSYFFDIFLDAGSYTISNIGVTRSDCAKVDYYLDNVLIVSGQDWYTAAATVDVTKTTGAITVPTPGYHVLEIRVNGKHASSTDYRMFFTKLTFRPTAY